MDALPRRAEERLFIQLRRTGDAEIREVLIRRYLPLARRAAWRFQRPGDSFDDLYQVACYALVKAVDGFDASRGFAFATYALPTITGELKRHARDAGWGLRVARGLQERVLAVERAVAALTSEHGRSPSPSRVAEVTGLTSEEVLEAMEAASNHHLESLDANVSGDPDGLTRLDTIGAVDPNYERVEDANAVAPALRDLPRRERQLLALRFGEELSQSEIASRLGISQMHVSRLLRRTLNELAQEVEVTGLAS